MTSEELREYARQMAESVSSQLDDKHRTAIAEGAHAVMQGLRSCVSSDEDAASAALAFVKLLTAIGHAPVSNVSDVIEHTTAGYALAAGALMGVYALPEPKESAPADVQTQLPFDSGYGYNPDSRYL